MFKISVWHGNLSESYLRYVTQLGVDCLDFGSGDSFPGVKEQGYPALDEVLKIKKQIRSWGLDINRVTLPHRGGGRGGGSSSSATGGGGAGSSSVNLCVFI